MDSATIVNSGLQSHIDNATLRVVLQYMQTVSPIIIVLVFSIAFVANSIISARKVKCNAAVTTGPGGRPLPTRMRSTAVIVTDTVEDFSPNVKLVFKWLSVSILLTFVADAALNMSHVMLHRLEHWWAGQSVVIYIVGSFFAWTVVLISLVDTTPSPTFAQLYPWVLAVPLELTMLAAHFALYTSPHHEPVVGDPRGGPLKKKITAWESIEVVIALVRLLTLVGIVLLYTFNSTSWTPNEGGRVGGANETTGLLRPDSSANNGMNGNGYGSAETTPKAQTSKPAEVEAAWARPSSAPATTWWEYLSGYSVFFPYLWPSKSHRLQLVVMFCFSLVLLQRVVNVLVPYQVGIIIDDLSSDEIGFQQVPWVGICLYVFYRFLQGSQGLIGSLRSFLWIPVSQYSYMELSTAAFEHVHGLSLDFHLGKKTGEVISALNKGNSINNFLEQVTFQVLPMLIDLCVAIGYFMIAFDVYYALVVTIVTFAYLYVTIRLAQWRAEIRRTMTNMSRQEDAVKNDSIISYETVKYFNAEQYEFGRYRSAVTDFQKAEYQVLFSLSLLNTSQNTVFMLGLMVTCFIAAFQVATGERKVGQFVTLLTYMAQLQGPLNFFGTFYRTIQNSLINSERLLELFREQPTVVDGPLASKLPGCMGDIKFDKVEFAYDCRKPALNGLSFHCKPGTTTALVGESGGGKSTVFRLLFRFYNAASGGILVDDRKVETITIDSLRSHIGVVPQDTILFNETIMYNLRYANPAATDEEVYDACRAASIHHRILTFPDGYETKVGERGLRLSGGEKQRVAIARTILKNPRIILLDEATAALDTETEEHIQGALSTLSKGRTMLVIAHRLSTITTADQILVLQNGQVIERGTHEQLLSLKGRYSSMWRKQIRAQRAAAEAQVLQVRAERLRSASTTAGGEDSSSQSDEEHSKGNETPEEKPTRPPLGQRWSKISDAKGTTQ
ncbi:ATP-binding cassette-type vacuolar membrane transporter Hmt1 [Ophidiomyces ophidiicola]|nr:ATP-binding cassette-type vacuolar membrane transporter Hmt1 [Ophidiomyces ophidiicola]